MPSRLWRFARWFALGVVALIATSIAYLLLAFPRSQPAADLTIEATAQRLERGRYLVEHVANCLDCHSDRDWRFYGGPVVAGTKGQGAPLRVLRPQIESANITPAALGEWTDGEIVRAITAGIGHDGRALHPFMPYDTYAKMTAEDVYSVVVYLRSLPAIDNSPPRPDDGLLINLVGRALPKPWEPPPAIEPGVTVEYGRYLTEIAECSFCHGSDFAGGRMFRIPDSDQEWPSENLTPHPTNRIGAWERENFIGVFKSFAPPAGREIPGDEINTVMPWSRFAGMTDEDLGAIYEYLQTVPPIAQEQPKPAE